MNSIAIGSFRNKADMKAQFQKYDELLKLQMKLQKDYAKANDRVFADSGQVPSRPAEIGEFLPVEVQEQDVFKQKQIFRQNLLKIFRNEQDLSRAISLINPDEYLDFNRAFPTFFQAIKDRVYAIRPEDFSVYWDAWKIEKIRKIKGNTVIGVEIPSARNLMENIANRLRTWIVELPNLSQKEKYEELKEIDDRLLHNDFNWFEKKYQKGKHSWLSYSKDERRKKSEQKRQQAQQQPDEEKPGQKLPPQTPSPKQPSSEPEEEKKEFKPEDVKPEDVSINYATPEWMSLNPSAQMEYKRGKNEDYQEWARKLLNKFTNANEETIENYIQKRRTTTLPDTLFKSFYEYRSQVGEGLKRGRKRVSRLVGRGLEVEPSIRYLTFGKYLIDKDNLYDSMKPKMKVLYPSKSPVIGFPVQMISLDMAKVIRGIIESGKVAFKEFQSLPVRERTLLQSLLNKAKLAEQLGLEGVLPEESEKDLKRFEIVKGQILAGNNAPQLLKELKNLILKFTGSGMMPKSQANQLLFELNHLV